MKRFLWVVTVAAALLLGYPTPALARGSATVVMEAESGRVLYAQNEQEKLPMASTTKIMTALLALEQPELDREFVVDSAAIRVEGSSMGLQEGDTVTLRALAGGMLTASGNDAANAAAKAIAGGATPFAAMMNDRAADIGMQNTHFVTPSGLDDEEHYSTAYDMALLARYALQNPLFAQMCGNQKLTLRFGNPPYDRTLYNHNRLLSLYPSAIGVKTGFTKAAGRCLVSAAREGEVTLIVVTLGVGDDWNVHRALYRQYFETVERVELPATEGLALPVVGGALPLLPLAQTQPVCAVSVNGEPPVVTTELFLPNFLYPPIKKGDIAGKIVYYREDRLLGESPLVAAQDVAAAAPPKRGPIASLWRSAIDWLWQTTG